MQSVDEFKPSTTEPVFGSGLISQNKISQQETNESENIVPPSEPVVNGENDSSINKPTSNENITNDKTETNNDKTDAGDTSTVHVNGQNEKPPIETTSEVQPTEKVDEVVAPMEPKPMDTTNEVSSTEPTSTVETATAPVETTTNDQVPEVSVAVESETPERRGRSPRGKAKAAAAPVVSTTPTRQSTRGRKAASSSSTNVEENQSIQDTSATTSITNQNESSATTSSQPSSTTGGSVATDDTHDQEMSSTDASVTEKATPSPGRKRAAPAAANSAKKPRGKTSVTSTDDANNDVTAIATNEGETITTPTKKARTSANKKTPEPPSEEYVRKLRPRK